MPKGKYKKSRNIWIKEQNAPKVSVIATLNEIKDFVHWCKKDEKLAGFNALVSKIPGKSYIIAKHVDSLKPKHVLHVWMDICDPLQRPLVFNAINEALYGVSMTPEALEDEMVCKVKE